MPLKLFYITNQPEIALIAENAGVDRIFVDMEYIGKQDRQGGLDTVQNKHTVEDVRNIRAVLKKSQLLVRVNPIHNASLEYTDTEDEINQVIKAGADVVMLPMYRSVKDVQRFINAVNGRATTLLLCETIEAANSLGSVSILDGVDEVHIGLNDLHLALNKTFMFELLANGTVDKLTTILRKSGKPFGFGGIARLGYGMLPAERIIAEHYRLGSSMAILSRSFCNVDHIKSIDNVRDIFNKEVIKIRKAENIFNNYTPAQFEDNRKEVIKLTSHIVEKILSH